MTDAWVIILTMASINSTLAILLIIVKFFTVRWAVQLEMDGVTKKITKRLDASEIFLVAAEQHTALLKDWERNRLEDHERRQQEQTEALKKYIEEQVAKRLKESEQKVVMEVREVPDRVVEKVAADGDSGLRKKLGTSDSHQGTTPPT